MFGVADPVGDLHAGAVRVHLGLFLTLHFMGSRPQLELLSTPSKMVFI